MSILTTIAGIPLFSTVGEALVWARANNLSGYHTHGWQGQVGYMGGASHIQATGMPANSNAPIVNTTRTARVLNPSAPRTNVPRTNIPRPTRTSGSGGGY
jgi:hypothetical protein